MTQNGAVKSLFLNTDLATTVNSYYMYFIHGIQVLLYSRKYYMHKTLFDNLEAQKYHTYVM